MRLLFYFLLFSVSPACLYGQNDYSFFYIESEVDAGIYVKVEGQMQPRYGHSYSIIPNLGEGQTQFEIHFQQNIYPAQKFWLYVPENAYRGFVLKKISEEQFVLYDLQQKKYIMAGNAMGDDSIGNYFVADHTGNALLPMELGKNEQQESQLPPSSDVSKSEKEVVPHEQNEFIEGVIINKTNSGEQASKEGIIGPKALSDCQTAIGNEDFEDIAILFMALDGDQDKINFLKNRLGAHCYSTEQIRILGTHIEGQAARYDAIKLLYPYTFDQEKYKHLESLFHTPFFKEKLKEIME